MGRSQGFLVRRFEAVRQNHVFILTGGKPVILGLALPLLSLVPAFATPARAPDAPETGLLTTYSRGIHDLNRRFGKAGAHNQILFIDRDEVIRRMAQMPRGVARGIALQKAVQDYVLERSGIRLPESFSDAVVLGIGGGGGQSLTIALQGKAGPGSLCMVTGNNPDLSAKAYQQNLMGLIEGFYDDFRSLPMLRQLSPEVSEKFNDYHELGHCMDKHYITAFLNDPDARQDTAREINLRHQSEAVAEVFAALMLARDGHTDVAGIRADQRLIYVATTGYLMTQMAGLDQFSKYVGFVYALHEVLWDAQREIDRVGPDALSTMSPQEIADLAYRITERDALGVAGADHTVKDLLEGRFKLDVWETLRKNSPDAEERYRVALRVRDHISESFVRMFGAEAFDPFLPVHETLARELTPGLRGNAPDAEKIQRDIIRIAESLRQGSARHDDPEMQIVLNAAREKERLRGRLNDPTLPEDTRAREMADLVLMADAMRMAITTLRQERSAVPSRDNHVRLIVPMTLSLAGRTPE